MSAQLTPEASFKIKPIAEMSLPEIVDEFGDRELQVDQFDPVLKRHEALKDAIKTAFAAHPAERDASSLGERWEVRLSAKRNESRWISKLKVWKLLGGLKSIDLWDVSGKAVTDAIGEGATKSLQIKEQTGYRTITTVLRGKAA